MTVRSCIRSASSVSLTIATLACAPTQSAPSLAPAVAEPAPPVCPPRCGLAPDAPLDDTALEARRFQIENSEIVELPSPETGRKYDLIIGLPPSFDKEAEQRYPTLYLLDGQWDFTLINMLAGGLRYDQVVPEFLIVGITCAGEDPDHEALRAQDYTPTKATPPNAAKAFGGDAPRFLKFLERSVIPLVENRYRGDPAHRILSGASFGGLFTLFALFEQPTLFHSYLALSPAVLWDQRWLFNREQEFRVNHTSLKRRVWLSVADQERPEYTQANKDFFDQFRLSDYEGVVLRTRIIEGERHTGNKPEAYNRAVRFAFEEWAKQHASE